MSQNQQHNDIDTSVVLGTAVTLALFVLFVVLASLTSVPDGTVG